MLPNYNVRVSGSLPQTLGTYRVTEKGIQEFCEYFPMHKINARDLMSKLRTGDTAYIINDGSKELYFTARKDTTGNGLVANLIHSGYNGVSRALMTDVETWAERSFGKKVDG